MALPILGVVTAIGGVLTSNNQARAAAEVRKAQEAEKEMQLALSAQKSEKFNKLLLYGGGGIGAILLLRILLK